jgi:hypothetical protein
LLTKGGIAKGAFLVWPNLDLIVVRLVRWEQVGYGLREYVLELLVSIGQFLFYQLLIYKFTFFFAKLVIG